MDGDSQAIVIRGVADTAGGPPVSGGRLAIRLAGVAEPDRIVQLNGATAQGVVARGRTLIVPLTADQPGPLSAGPLEVQVIREEPDGARSASAMHQTVLLPRIVSHRVDRNAGQLEVTTVLKLLPNDLAAILLDPAERTSHDSYRLDCPALDAPGTRLAGSIEGVRRGRYFVRVEIAGVSSWLDFVDDSPVGPVVEI